MSEVTVIQLRDALVKYFNETELRGLCFELGEDYDSFGGSGKNGKALEIATWSERHGRFDELVAIVKRERPHAFPGANVVAANANRAATDAQESQNKGITYNIHGGTFVGSNIGSGNIAADNLAGGDIKIDNRKYSAGRDMYVAGGDINIHAPETKDEFKAQLAELQKLVEQAIADGAFADEDDADTAVSDLRRIAKETAKPQPNAESIKARMNDVKGILEATTATAKSAGKTAVALAKAAALSGVLYDTVTKLFS